MADLKGFPRFVSVKLNEQGEEYNLRLIPTVEDMQDLINTVGGESNITEIINAERKILTRSIDDKETIEAVLSLQWIPILKELFVAWKFMTRVEAEDMFKLDSKKVESLMEKKQ